MKNLIEITCSNDVSRVYTMGMGVSWDDLSDDEKKQLYESEKYLHHKVDMKSQLLLKELDSVRDEIISLLKKLSPGIVVEHPMDIE